MKHFCFVSTAELQKLSRRLLQQLSQRIFLFFVLLHRPDRILKQLVASSPRIVVSGTTFQRISGLSCAFGSLRPRQVAIATQTIAGSTGCQPARGQGSSGPQAGRAACLCAILKSLQSLHRFQGLEYHAKIAFVTLLRLAADVRTASGTQREIPGYEVRDLRLRDRKSVV